MSGRLFLLTGRSFEAIRHRFSGLILSFVLLVFPLAGHSESYLDAISVEAEKLEDAPTSAPGETKAESPASADAAFALFEKELETRYRGSYLFYKQLPARNRKRFSSSTRRGLQSTRFVRRL